MTLSTPVLLGIVGFGLALLAVSTRVTVGRWLAVALFCTYLVGVAHFALLPLTIDPLAPEKFGPIEIGRLIELRPFFRIALQEFLKAGTDSSQQLNDAQSREVVRTLGAVADRLEVTFSPPFRDFSGFKAYWGAHGGYGSWAVGNDGQ